MLHILAFLLIAPSASLPENSIKLRDRPSHPTAVTDKDLRPVRAPDCKTEAEIQKTLEQLSYGEPGDCFIRDIRRLSRR